jgi:hypothetical protein
MDYTRSNRVELQPEMITGVHEVDTAGKRMVVLLPVAAILPHLTEFPCRWSTEVVDVGGVDAAVLASDENALSASVVVPLTRVTDF